MKPHTTVGLVGLAIFLGTAVLVLANWTTLTDQHEFVASVTTHKQSFGVRQAQVGTGQSSTQSFSVDHPNVFRVAELRVTWDEGSVLPGQTGHTVTVVLHDATGAEVARETGASGGSGVTLSKTLFDPPTGRSFTGRGDGRDAFDRLYPTHTESVGAWKATVTPQRASGSGPTSIDYTMTFVLEHYRVTYRDVEAAETSK